METLEIVQILAKATKTDLFFDDATPIENQIVFIKNFYTDRFVGTEIITKSDYNTRKIKGVVENISSNYTIDQLNEGLKMGVYYVLVSEKRNQLDEKVYFQINKATEDDLLYNPKFVKQNSIYYIRLNEDDITGPHVLPETANTDRLKQMISDGKIYIPNRKPTFEKVVHQPIKKAS